MKHLVLAGLMLLSPAVINAQSMSALIGIGAAGGGYEVEVAESVTEVSVKPGLLLTARLKLDVTEVFGTVFGVDYSIPRGADTETEGQRLGHLVPFIGLGPVVENHLIFVGLNYSQWNYEKGDLDLTNKMGLSLGYLYEFEGAWISLTVHNLVSELDSDILPADLKAWNVHFCAGFAF